MNSNGISIETVLNPRWGFLNKEYKMERNLAGKVKL
jgi:hypothetical protein